MPARTLLIAFCAFCALLAQLSSAQLVPNAKIDTSRLRDPRTTPPIAERAAIQLLQQPTKAGNALLFVEFSRGEPVGRTVTITLEQGNVTLHDDGTGGDQKPNDGIYTALILVPPDVRQRESHLLAPGTAVPIFVGREKVADATIRQTDQRFTLDTLRTIPAVPNRSNIGPKREDLRRFQIPNIPPAARFLPIFPFISPSSIDAQSALMITDTNVVNDARANNPCSFPTTTAPLQGTLGKWSFGYLITQLANQGATGLDPEQFTRRWLRRWLFPQTVNDFPVGARPAVQAEIINLWPKLTSGALDLSRAPFQLLAIVNRVDLRQNLLYGGGSAGEARFVYGLVDPNGCTHKPMTVIFEYGIKKPSCMAVKAWAQQWQNLSANPVGTGPYNNALEVITRQFTDAGVNTAQLPNHSALNQLRTNEIALASPWELREFHLASDDSDIGHLREVTVKQTPDDTTINNSATVASFINTNATTILQDKHLVTLEFPPGSAFLGGAAPVPSSSHFWDGPPPHPSTAITTSDSRFHFSLNTCNGCHAGETATQFTHVHPTPPIGGLSLFLTGIMVTDPAGEGVTRSFNDLQRRQVDMANLLSRPCFFQLFFDPLRMTH